MQSFSPWFVIHWRVVGETHCVLCACQSFPSCIRCSGHGRELHAYALPCGLHARIAAFPLQIAPRCGTFLRAAGHESLKTVAVVRCEGVIQRLQPGHYPVVTATDLRCHRFVLMQRSGDNAIRSGDFHQLLRSQSVSFSAVSLMCSIARPPGTHRCGVVLRHGQVDLSRVSDRQ